MLSATRTYLREQQPEMPEAAATCSTDWTGGIASTRRAAWKPLVFNTWTREVRHALWKPLTDGYQGDAPTREPDLTITLETLVRPVASRGCTSN